MIKTKPLLINVFFTILAIGLHFYLAQKFYDLQNGSAHGGSFCNLSSLWNCDAVSSSKYAQLFGYPLALWALVVNFLFLIVQVMTWVQKESDSFWGNATKVGALVIAISSVVMLIISFTQLKNLCLFCFIVYGLSFLGLGLLAVAGLSPFKVINPLISLAKDKMTYGFLAAVPVFVLILSSSLGGAMSDSRAQGVINDQVTAWQVAPVRTFDLSLGLHLGAPIDQAKMVIVEFADFRCPHCKFAAPSMKAFTQSRTDVALIFKPFPLDGTCNPGPSFGGRGDGISCRLAFATFCAQKLEGKGWEMSESIFKRQEDFRQMPNIEKTDSLLCELGVTGQCDSLKACMSQDTTKIEIQKMAQEGISAEIQGTPAFFVNGKNLSGGQYIPVLEATEKRINK